MFLQRCFLSLNNSVLTIEAKLISCGTEGGRKKRKERRMEGETEKEGRGKQSRANKIISLLFGNVTWSC